MYYTIRIPLLMEFGLMKTTIKAQLFMEENIFVHKWNIVKHNNKMMTKQRIFLICLRQMMRYRTFRSKHSFHKTYFQLNNIRYTNFTPKFHISISISSKNIYYRFVNRFFVLIFIPHLFIS